MTRDEARRAMFFAKREVLADSYIDEAYDMAIKALEEPERHWIPCSERLPEPPSYCLVTTDGSHNDVIDIALYMSDGWHKASEVIAWMPLPEPYKGDEHDYKE